MSIGFGNFGIGRPLPGWAENLTPSHPARDGQQLEHTEFFGDIIGWVIYQY